MLSIKLKHNCLVLLNTLAVATVGWLAKSLIINRIVVNVRFHIYCYRSVIVYIIKFSIINIRSCQPVVSVLIVNIITVKCCASEPTMLLSAIVFPYQIKMFMVHLIYEVGSLLITNNILSVNISRGHAVYTAILFPAQKTDFLKVEKREQWMAVK